MSQHYCFCLFYTFYIVHLFSVYMHGYTICLVTLQREAVCFQSLLEPVWQSQELTQNKVSLGDHCLPDNVSISECLASLMSDQLTAAPTGSCRKGVRWPLCQQNPQQPERKDSRAFKKYSFVNSLTISHSIQSILIISTSYPPFLLLLTPCNRTPDPALSFYGSLNSVIPHCILMGVGPSTGCWYTTGKLSFWRWRPWCGKSQNMMQESIIRARNMECVSPVC